MIYKSSEWVYRIVKRTYDNDLVLFIVQLKRPEHDETFWGDFLWQRSDSHESAIKLIKECIDMDNSKIKVISEEIL